MNEETFWSDTSYEFPMSQGFREAQAQAQKAHLRGPGSNGLSYGVSTPTRARQHLMENRIQPLPCALPLQRTKTPLTEIWERRDYLARYVSPQELDASPSISNDPPRQRTRPTKAPLFERQEFTPADPDNPWNAKLGEVTPQISRNEEKKRRHEQKLKQASAASGSTMAGSSSRGRQQETQKDKAKGKQRDVGFVRSKSETCIDLTMDDEDEDEDEALRGRNDGGSFIDIDAPSVEQGERGRASGSSRTKYMPPPVLLTRSASVADTRLPSSDIFSSSSASYRESRAREPPPVKAVSAAARAQPTLQQHAPSARATALNSYKFGSSAKTNTRPEHQGLSGKAKDKQRATEPTLTDRTNTPSSEDDGCSMDVDEPETVRADTSSLEDVPLPTRPRSHVKPTSAADPQDNFFSAASSALQKCRTRDPSPVKPVKYAPSGPQPPPAPSARPLKPNPPLNFGPPTSTPLTGPSATPGASQHRPRGLVNASSARKPFKVPRLSQTSQHEGLARTVSMKGARMTVHTVARVVSGPASLASSVTSSGAGSYAAPSYSDTSFEGTLSGDANRTSSAAYGSGGMENRRMSNAESPPASASDDEDEEMSEEAQAARRSPSPEVDLQADSSFSDMPLPWNEQELEEGWSKTFGGRPLSPEY